MFCSQNLEKGRSFIFLNDRLQGRSRRQHIWYIMTVDLSPEIQFQWTTSSWSDWWVDALILSPEADLVTMWFHRELDLPAQLWIWTRTDPTCWQTKLLQQSSKINSNWTYSTHHVQLTSWNCRLNKMRKYIAFYYTVGHPGQHKNVLQLKTK